MQANCTIKALKAWIHASTSLIEVQQLTPRCARHAESSPAGHISQSTSPRSSHARHAALHCTLNIDSTFTGATNCCRDECLTALGSACRMISRKFSLSKSLSSGSILCHLTLIINRCDGSAPHLRLVDTDRQGVVIACLQRRGAQNHLMLQLIHKQTCTILCNEAAAGQSHLQLDGILGLACIQSQVISNFGSLST